MITRASFILPGDYFAAGRVECVVPSYRHTHVNVIVSNVDLTASVYRMSNNAIVWIIPRENGK